MLQARELTDSEILERVRCEYLELPALCLTFAQALRLWNLDRVTCERVLNSLLASSFLCRMPDGRFVRTDRLTGPAAAA